MVMIYVRFPLSLRNVEDLLFERGIDISHETVQLWWTRFGRLPRMRNLSNVSTIAKRSFGDELHFLRFCSDRG